MLSFDYRQAMDLDDLPLMDAAELRDRLTGAVAEGWRVLAFFGLPEAARGPDASGPVGLCCVLGHDAARMLTALRTPPLERFDSLTPDCPQVHLFEREIYEQWRVEPVGHPWLKAVRRTPDGMRGGAKSDAPADYPFYRADGGEVHEVAVGPVHAGIIEPGHFRFQCHGEIVLHLEIALGYQHRGLEAMLTHGPAGRRLPLLECAAGDSSVAHATAHCVLWERLTGTGVPQRAQLVRRIGLELERLANHCGDLGAIAGDTGFLPTSSWNGRIRGDFLNMTASLCGNRFGRGLLRYGGVAWDLDPAGYEDLAARLRAAGRDTRGAVDIMLEAASVRDRLAGIGALCPEDARVLGLVGVPARACGLDLDARFHAPLSELPVGDHGPRRERGGDVLARALVRSHELDDSLALLREDLARLAACPETPAVSALSWPPRLPARKLAVAQVEGWRGEICHLAVTGTNGEPLVCKIVDPSFHNWPGLALAMRGGQISDFPLCNKSFNLSYCGHDL